MMQELNSLLNDVDQYLEGEAGSYPHRYKRLDPRSLLGRAYTLLRHFEGVVHDMEEIDTYNYCYCWREIDKDDEDDEVDNDDTKP